MKTIRIGARGSALARHQADHVARVLRASHGPLETEVQVIATTGDRILDSPLAEIGGKGLFTKEIEEALLDGRVDIAVHSLKDLPTKLPDGLRLGAVLARIDPSDVLVSVAGRKFHDLPEGARIGTSSLRRQAQLLHARSDLRIETLRGNVPTRLRKVSSGEIDAAVLARAGLERLGLLDVIAEVLGTELLLPAPGQGALAVEVRDPDEEIASILRGIDDPAARAETAAERAFLDALGGGCQIPVGALARLLPGASGQLDLEGVVASPDGTALLRARRGGLASEPQSVGESLARELIARGAGAILGELGAGGSGWVSP